jgi:hypothetical protein
MRTKKRYITLWRIDIDMLITSMFSLQLNIKINELENKKQFKCTWARSRTVYCITRCEKIIEYTGTPVNIV